MRTKVFVRLLSKPKLREPYMVCGLPDSGHVAKLVMDHLITEVGGSLFAEVYSYSLPPRVFMKPDGTVEPLKHELYYWVNPDGGRDLIMYTGDAQPTNPEAAYMVADKVIRLGKKLGARLVITVGAFITGAFVEAPKVHGIATDQDLVKEMESRGIPPITEGDITWMNGLLLGVARLHGLKAMFFSGETSGYVVDAKAAKAVIEALAKWLDIKIDMAAMEERARETEASIRTMEAMMEKRKPTKGETGYIG